MKPRLVLLLCLLAVPGPVLAQEDEDELRDLDAELREARRQRTHLKATLELVDGRIKLLTQAQRLRKSLESLQKQIEKAEDDGDDERAEELVEEARDTELSHEFVERRLEILEQRSGLLEVQLEIHGRAQEPLRREAGDLLKMLDRAMQLTASLEKAIRDDDDDEFESVSEQFERHERIYDRRRETLSLKAELYWAREEEDEDAIRELLEELKERGVSEKEDRPARPESKPDRPTGMLPAPVKVTDVDIDNAAKLDFQQEIVPLLRSACFECHDGDSASGDLNLEAMVKARPLVVNRSHWINVIQQLKVRSMPPMDAEQPSEKDRSTLTAWLTNAITNFDYETVRQPGYEPARRLTHEEYNNTIRDLTGIDIRPADRFPTDLTASSGFANSANSLFIQPITLERYIGAAESIVDEAWPETPSTADQKAAWQRLEGAVGNAGFFGDNASALHRFAIRAWRRRVDRDELQQLTTLYRKHRDEGASARGALRNVIQVVLVSPSFLVRTEREGPATGQAFRISDWELASRLSYFLWASMPDDELFRLAEAGRLHEPTVLTAQVERMLRDSRARTLGSLFAAQWLGFAGLDRVQRDQIDNPWATDSLVEAMKLESAMLFNSVVAGNLPIDRLVDADYTFLNEELARHYRMSGVRGKQMRQVSLRGSPRRGILGHGSILAVTSFPGRTSPVVRGNWILSRLLGTPPPPPPPNVSEFDDRVADNDRLSQRQKLEKHRSNPNCYACHSQIDPLGFALEEFEWFGRHRPERRGKRVDTSAKLPDGPAFQGLKGLSEALVKERIGDLSMQLTRKMLAYALGRQLEYYDEATVRELAEKLHHSGRRVPALIHAIVQSDTFQMKRIPEEPR